MSKKPVDKKRYHDEAFKVEALRILAASGRKIDEVAEDLGYVSPATFERTYAAEAGRENALH
jgi:transcriptional regulator GlxA family with amidase domain